MDEAALAVGLESLASHGPQIAAIVVCMAALAFSSLSEGVLMRVEVGRARQLASEGRRGASALLRLVEKRQEVLSTLVLSINLSIIVERADDSWTGPVGRVTKLLDEVDVPLEDTYAIVCGPPVMFKFVCNQLSEAGMPMHRMFVSLERRMHCGMGKCCRCNVGSTYVCLDGPVFDYWTVMNLKEAI